MAKSWRRFVTLFFVQSLRAALSWELPPALNPESSDVFANAPKFLARVTKTGDK
jgi:hypothetical protein